MASSKTAYVAFGGDASIGFASDEVLNRPSSRAFDDPPWKVFDSDVQFEPMFVEGFAPVAEADVSALESDGYLSMPRIQVHRPLTIQVRHQIRLIQMTRMGRSR
jgi:hypothetical protein